MVPSVR